MLSSRILIRSAMALCLFLAPVSVWAEESLEWYLKGNTFSREGKLDQAVEAYERSIRANPNATGPFYNLGLAFKGLKQYDRAIGALEAARNLEPDNLNIRLALGNVYNLMERWQQAIAHLNLVVHRDPENAEAHGNLGWAYFNYDEGPRFKMLTVMNLEKAVRLFEKDNLRAAADATRKTLELARERYHMPKPMEH